MPSTKRHSSNRLNAILKASRIRKANATKKKKLQDKKDRWHRRSERMIERALAKAVVENEETKETTDKPSKSKRFKTPEEIFGTDSDSDWTTI